MGSRGHSWTAGELGERGELRLQSCTTLQFSLPCASVVAWGGSRLSGREQGGTLRSRHCWRGPMGSRGHSGTAGESGERGELRLQSCTTLQFQLPCASVVAWGGTGLSGREQGGTLRSRHCWRGLMGSRGHSGTAGESGERGELRSQSCTTLRFSLPCASVVAWGGTGVSGRGQGGTLRSRHCWRHPMGSRGDGGPRESLVRGAS